MRYKQTVIGVLWALIRPLLTIVVFTVIFGKLAKLPSDGVPYPILVWLRFWKQRHSMWQNLAYPLERNTLNRTGVAHGIEWCGDFLKEALQ